MAKCSKWPNLYWRVERGITPFPYWVYKGDAFVVVHNHCLLCLFFCLALTILLLCRGYLGGDVTEKKLFTCLSLVLSYIWCRHAMFLFEPPHDKTNKMTVHPAKTQISLGFRPVWSESSLRAQWVAKDTNFLHADSEDSEQTGLIWVFARRKCHFVGFVMRRLIFPFLCRTWDLRWAHRSFCLFWHAAAQM